tara:strand:+ start:1403 stop:1732 length:330 start_codon:yes stop_codon:yes gene_type:complete
MKDRIECALVGAVAGIFPVSLAWLLFHDSSYVSRGDYFYWLRWGIPMFAVLGFLGQSRFLDASADFHGWSATRLAKTEGMPFGLPIPWLLVLIFFLVIIAGMLLAAAIS